MYRFSSILLFIIINHHCQILVKHTFTCSTLHCVSIFADIWDIKWCTSDCICLQFGTLPVRLVARTICFAFLLSLLLFTKCLFFALCLCLLHLDSELDKQKNSNRQEERKKSLSSTSKHKKTSSPFVNLLSGKYRSLQHKSHLKESSFHFLDNWAAASAGGRLLVSNCYKSIYLQIFITSSLTSLGAVSCSAATTTAGCHSLLN